jgi:hypothetical protein
MINNKIINSRWGTDPDNPPHSSTAPMARMFTRADRVIQHDPVLQHLRPLAA